MNHKKPSYLTIVIVLLTCGTLYKLNETPELASKKFGVSPSPLPKQNVQSQINTATTKMASQSNFEVKHTEQTESIVAPDELHPVEPYDASQDIHRRTRRSSQTLEEQMLAEPAPENPDDFNYIANEFSAADPDPDAAPDFVDEGENNVDATTSVDENYQAIRPDDEDEIPSSYESENNEYPEPAPELVYN